MEAHYLLNDDRFEQEFRDGRLDPEVFSHEAHLRLAWIHIKKYGVEKAVDNICDQLKQFTIHVGAADKYNLTLTVAAVRMVNHFMGRSVANDFADFIREFPQQKTRFKELILSHYGINIFSLPDAKKEYIKPDLLPFT